MFKFRGKKRQQEDRLTRLDDAVSKFRAGTPLEDAANSARLSSEEVIKHAEMQKATLLDRERQSEKKPYQR